MIDVPTCIHLTYDITTPSGNGGDRESARVNNQSFNAAYAIVHSGMKDLSDVKPELASLLFFYHTHVFKDGDRELILAHMGRHFWNQVDQKGMHCATVQKIPDFLDIVLSYSKQYISGNHDKKEAIAKYLGIAQESWYRKDRKACWDQWFKLMTRFLAQAHDEGLNFMHPYCEQIGSEHQRIKSLAHNLRSAWEII